MFFDNEDHSNYMGFTWERTSIGKVPVGIDTSDTDFNTIGKTGGEKTHTLSISEMPSHQHQIAYAKPNTADTHGTGYVYGQKDSTNTLMITASGGSQPHNNLQSYEVMAFWKRIS